MASPTITVTLPKSLLRQKEGMVLLPLNTWRSIEGDLEDLEMYRSETLVQEIAKRRKAKKTVPLQKLLKKYHI